MKAWPLLIIASGATAAFAQVPDVPEDLLNVSAISCVKMDDNGKVVGAYIVKSTGDAHRDREIVDWVKQLHWDKAKPGDKLRNVWFPMPVAFGDAKAPELPPTCQTTHD